MKTSIIIPVDDTVLSDQIKYTLRSIRKYLQVSDYQIILIGKDFSTIQEDISCIEYTDILPDPYMNDALKIRLAICDENVSEEFIWMPFGIYMVSPIEMADLQLLRACSFLESSQEQSIYNITQNRTINILNNNELPLWNYEINQPVVFKKEKLVELFNKYPDLYTNGYLFNSLYFNTFYPKHIPIQTDWRTDNLALRVANPNANRELFYQLIGKKRYLSNSVSGYSYLIKEYLTKHFM